MLRPQGATEDAVLPRRPRPADPALRRLQRPWPRRGLRVPDGVRLGRSTRLAIACHGSGRALRGTGVGSSLLSYALRDLALLDRTRPIWCNARLSAQGFYERHGWQAVSDPLTMAPQGAPCACCALPHRPLESRMSIAEPSPEQITECFKIEQSLGLTLLTPTPPDSSCPAPRKRCTKTSTRPATPASSSTTPGASARTWLSCHPGIPSLSARWRTTRRCCCVATPRVPTPSTRSGSPGRIAACCTSLRASPGAVCPGLCRLCRLHRLHDDGPLAKAQPRLRGLSRRHGHAAGGRVPQPASGEVKHIVNLFWRKQP